MTIKHHSKFLPMLVSFTLILFLTACGGGGGGGDDEDPVQVVKTAKLTIAIQRIDNTHGSNIGSVSLNIKSPDSFVLQSDANGIPTSMAILVAQGLNVQKEVHYNHPILTLYLIAANSFPTGNLVNFTRTLQRDETLPMKSSFQLELTEVSEISETGDVTIQTEDYKAILSIEEI